MLSFRPSFPKVLRESFLFFSYFDEKSFSFFIKNRNFKKWANIDWSESFCFFMVISMNHELGNNGLIRKATSPNVQPIMKFSSLLNSYLKCSSQLLPIKIIIIYAGEKAIDRRLHKARELVQWLFNWQVIEYASGQQVARWPKRLNKKTCSEVCNSFKIALDKIKNKYRLKGAPMLF